MVGLELKHNQAQKQASVDQTVAGKNRLLVHPSKLAMGGARLMGEHQISSASVVLSNLFF